MEFRDLKTQYKTYESEINNAIQTVINKTNFIGGEEVKDLEIELSKFVGVEHCITCANGTEAMTLLMMAWEIQPGDAIFIPILRSFPLEK